MYNDYTTARDTMKKKDKIKPKDNFKIIEDNKDDDNNKYKIQEEQEEVENNLEWVKDFYKHIKENKKTGFKKTSYMSLSMQLCKDENENEFFYCESDYSMNYGDVDLSHNDFFGVYETEENEDGQKYVCDKIAYDDFMTYLHQILKNDVFTEDFDLHETFKLLKTNWAENYGIESDEEIYPNIVFVDVVDCFGNDVDVIVNILIDNNYVIEDTSITKIEGICKQLNDMEQQRKDDDVIVLK